MAKTKLEHFADMKTMDCVFEPLLETLQGDTFPLKGKWNKEFFKNDNPIIVELGCGKGEYTVELAKKYPNKNYIGIDVKGARIWYGADTVRTLELKNAAFVRLRIDFILSIFEENEVDEIWLTFSDPQKEKPRKRLTSKMFMDRFRKILKPDGLIHLKTDSDILFESTEEQIAEAIKQLTWNENILIEGAAALAFAAFLVDKSLYREKVNIVLLCGGNYDKNVILPIISQTL